MNGRKRRKERRREREGKKEGGKGRERGGRKEGSCFKFRKVVCMKVWRVVKGL